MPIVLPKLYLVDQKGARGTIEEMPTMGDDRGWQTNVVEAYCLLHWSLYYM